VQSELDVHSGDGGLVTPTEVAVAGTTGAFVMMVVAVLGGAAGVFAVVGSWVLVGLVTQARGRQSAGITLSLHSDGISRIKDSGYLHFRGGNSSTQKDFTGHG
jgi:hypothetical protein